MCICESIISSMNIMMKSLTITNRKCLYLAKENVLFENNNNFTDKIIFSRHNIIYLNNI